MNAWFKILAITAASLPLPLLADSACAPQALESSTRFPLRSQLRGQAGIVQLDVEIDRSGRVASTELVRSSGYRLLDRAARESALKDWVFDVSACDRDDLPASRRIVVEYRNDEYR